MCGVTVPPGEISCLECGTHGLLSRAEKMLASRSDNRVRAAAAAASAVAAILHERAEARKDRRPTHARIRRVIEGVCRKHLGKNLGDHQFYTPKEWAARGEPYLNKALLCMTFEGPIYDLINMNARNGAAFVDDLTNALSGIGVYYELGYAWCLGVYPA